MNLLNYFKNENIRRTILVNSILFLLILIPNLLYCFYSPEITSLRFFSKFFFFFFFLSIFLFPFLFFSFRLSFILFFPLFLFSFLEYYHISVFGTILNESSLSTIFATNLNETKELLLSLIYWIIIIILFSIFYLVLCFSKYTRHKLLKKTRIYLSCFIILIFSVDFTYNFYLHIGDKDNTGDLTDYTIVTDLKNAYKTSLRKYNRMYPFSVINKTKNIYNLKNYESMFVDYKFNVTYLNNNKSPIVIFVIGESSRYKNWQINGYERETSPYITSLNNIYSFSDYYSSSNTTIASLPFLYTRSTPINPDIIYSEKSFISFYKELNYKTFLINNQFLYTSGFLLRVKNEFDEYYEVLKKNRNAENYDSNIFSVFNDVINNNNEKKLVVIHLMGNHFKYGLRYPQKFEKYKPCKTSSGIFSDKNIDKKDKQLYVNEYDNSVLYNDYILWKIIYEIDNINREAVVFFVSDHGENLFDDSDTNMFHGSPIPYKSEFHVPFFMWFSDEYIANNKDKVENAVKNKDKRLTSENLFYTLINLSDVDFETNDLSKSIMSDIFKQDSVRKVLCPSGVYDFN